jgi:phospholipid transport system transporter-binding protein
MVATLTLPAQLSVQLGRAALDTLTRDADALPPGSPAVLDASALRLFDSSALALILGLKRHCQATGRSLQVQGLPERLCGLARLYGVDGLILA